MAYDMPKPCKFSSLDSCQKRFLWTHKEVDLFLHPAVAGQQGPYKAAGSVYFTAVEEDEGDKRLVELKLLPKLMVLHCQILFSLATAAIAIAVENIFNSQVITEKHLQHQHNLFHNFIDFNKALDSVWHAGLWKVLRSFNTDEGLVQATQALYQNSSSAMQSS